jgi:hypothetical protein
MLNPSPARTASSTLFAEFGSTICAGQRPPDRATSGGVSLGRFLSVDPVTRGSANGYDYAFGDPINGYDLSGFCGLFGNPFKKCKDPEPEFDVGTIDRATGEVVSLAPRTEGPGNFPNSPMAAVQYNLEIIEGAADATTVVAAGAAFTPCSVACAGGAIISSGIGGVANAGSTILQSRL